MLAAVAQLAFVKTCATFQTLCS